MDHPQLPLTLNWSVSSAQRLSVTQLPCPSWHTPLYSSTSSALNPAFYYVVANVFNAFMGSFALYQLFSLMKFNKVQYTMGSALDSRSCGIGHIFRITCVVVHACVLIILAFQNSSITCAISATTILTFFLPLHIIEPTRSIHQLASLLFYWFGSSIIALTPLIQDTHSDIKLINHSNSALSVTLEVFLVIDNFLIIALETYFWQPSRELVDYYQLNDWDILSTRNILSHWTFTWVQTFVSKIFKENATSIDTLPGAPADTKCESTLSKLKAQWNREKDQLSAGKLNSWFRRKLINSANQIPKPSLFIALIKAFGVLLMVATSYDVIDRLLSIVQPVVLEKLIIFFTEYSTDTAARPMIIGYYYALIMLSVALGRVIISNQSTSCQRRSGFIIQSSLMAMIYDKVIRLNTTKRTRSTGDILNHASTDVALAKNTIESIQKFIEAMIELTVCFIPLYKFLGSAIIGSIAAAALSIPIATMVEMSLSPTFAQLSKYRDERTSIISNILSSIKSIKLHSWEQPILNKLNDIRANKELKATKRIGLVHSFSMFIWGVIPFCMMIAGLATSVYFYHVPLTPQVVFPTLSVLSSISTTVYQLPYLITYAVQARKSFGRLRDLLLLDEVDDTVNRSPSPPKLGDTCIRVDNTSLLWSKPKRTSSVFSNNIALSISSLSIAKGEMACLVGPFGSGKTSLLRSFLGEMYVSGETPDRPASISVNGSIAYCSQNAWIINSTVRDNILFGRDYEPSLYWKVIEACQLHDAFNSFPQRDKSRVGERGISLSGGQKARISLARAIYSRADIYLFDDILASIDLHIGKVILENLFSQTGLLRQGQTSVIVTNSMSVIEKSDQVVFLKRGRMVGKSDYQSVLKESAQSELRRMLKRLDQKACIHIAPCDTSCNTSETTVSHDAVSTISSSDDELEDYAVDEFNYDSEDSEACDTRSFIDCPNLERQLTRDTFGRSYSFMSVDHDFESVTSGQNKRLKRFPTVEETTKGNIRPHILFDFLKACDLKCVSIYLLLITLAMTADTIKIYSLTYFPSKNDDEKVNIEHGHGENNGSTKYLLIYLSLGVLKCTFDMLASYEVWSYCIIRAAYYLHDKLARSVLYSHMSFFETNPNGRIVNRFTNDIRILDMNIPVELTDFATLLLKLLATFIVIVLNLPIMATVFLVSTVLYSWVRYYLAPAIRELQRLQSALVSPVLSHIQETVQGLESLRVYNQVEQYHAKNIRNLNSLLTVEQALSSTNRWLAVRMESISALITFFCVCLSLNSLLHHEDTPVTPEILGLLVTYSLTLTSTLDATVTVSAELQAELISLERVMDYFDLVQEGPMIIDDNRPPANWPDQGNITISNLTLTYHLGQPPVLKNISCQFRAGEKVSIVGKTGAGKSTLTLALFRLIEPLGGSIKIDGIDTRSIGLYDLRHKLNIVPQGSQSIIGSVRDKLDPFGQFEDTELWRALEMVQLKDHVAMISATLANRASGGDTHQNPLDMRLDEAGNNLSVGQRQLLSLARALLVPSKILILDEATSSLDLYTVRIIRDIIKHRFQGATIITIAHRAETIMDSDKVLMLEHGEAVEFDSPSKLLSQPNSRFFSFCAEGLVD